MYGKAALENKSMALLPASWSAEARHHLEREMIETELPWRPEKKEQSQFRKPGVSVDSIFTRDGHERKC
jgi:hypothetical protein